MGRSRFLNLPIGAQVMALLIGVLIVSQLATLTLSFAFPPTPPPQHSLQDIARALRGEALQDTGARPLLRQERNVPPARSGPGWLTVDAPRHDLAGLLGVSAADVRLMFYVPAPTTVMPPGSPRREVAELDPDTHLASFTQASFLPLLLQQAAPGPPPGGSFGSRQDPSRSAPDTTPGRHGERDGGRFQRQDQPERRAPPTGTRIVRSDRAAGRNDPASGQASPLREPPPAEQTQARPPVPRQPANDGSPPPPPSVGPIEPPSSVTVPTTGGPPSPTSGSATDPPVSASAIQETQTASPAPSPRLPTTPAPRSVAAPVAPDVGSAAGVTTNVPSVTSPSLVAARPDAAAGVGGVSTSGDVERLVSPSRAFFGPRGQGFVEGDFIAALRLSNGRWVVVEPEPEAFPTAWHKRMMLWFALSLGIVAPIGWIFARRLTAPLRGFAAAAERLGRNPGMPVAVTDGPAEVGRAARAFNDMQLRLSRYVEDRTAMIGAISHDLRNPLARMRFRVERDRSEAHDDYVRDIEQMDEMITSVLTFLREDAEPARRQRVDLRSLVEVAVDDAVAVGALVELEPGEAAEVEIDVPGMQRVFTNLLDNAIKYGGAARVRLRREGHDVIAAVCDPGPGLSAQEIETAFLPFHRSTRHADIQGFGLGLATTRSIVRAHGGDVQLFSVNGLTAEVRLPLAA